LRLLGREKGRAVLQITLKVLMIEMMAPSYCSMTAVLCQLAVSKSHRCPQPKQRC
jgi:hypothetical protein